MRRAVEQHYGRGGLEAAILRALRDAGKDPDRLVPDDLTPVDQFHIGSRPASLALMRISGIRQGMSVLDAGGGIGGPARMLAAETGCRVTVLDLTEEYCVVGKGLTERTGLADRVDFRHGDATEMPFPDGSFDAVWTQHSGMNIRDKSRLYAECRRILRPRGRLVLHEILEGTVRPVHFPVPWARDPSLSFLIPPESLRSLLQRSGFRESAWHDVSEESMAWWRERLAAAPPSGGPPPLGLHLILGPDTLTMGRNVARNLEEERIVVVRAVFDAA